MSEPIPVSAPASALPIFYAQPVLLDARAHADWRLAPGDAAFAANEPAIALTPGEFALASRSYPIVFTSGEAGPVALLGLERANLFVDAAGRWAEGAYVPAYVRRYPFVLAAAADRGAGLAVDAASPLIARGGDAGEPLFQDGGPSAATLRALEFCRQYWADHESGRAFCRALLDEALLVDRQADAVLPDGRKLAVTGFKVVDPERFAAISEEKVVDWHRKGWLALVHFHLASLQRLQDLLIRQAERDGSGAEMEARTAKPARAAR